MGEVTAPHGRALAYVRPALSGRDEAPGSAAADRAACGISGAHELFRRVLLRRRIALSSIVAEGVVRGGRRQGFWIREAHHAFPDVWDPRFTPTGANRISRPQRHGRWPSISL